MQAVYRELLAPYWQIGQHIVEFEQAGQVRAEYGKALIAQLARALSLRHGKGFSRSKLIRIRQFYLCYQKGATLSHQLSWSHFVELLKIDDPLERGFYEKQAIAERWSVRELTRQKNILRCFVLLDLKLGDVQHQDIGQMNMYLGYFANEENIEGDNPPIGIILSRNKDELLVEYAMYNMSSQLFVQKYQLYLPETEELRRELEMTLRDVGSQGQAPESPP